MPAEGTITEKFGREYYTYNPNLTEGPSTQILSTVVQPEYTASNDDNGGD